MKKINSIFQNHKLLFVAVVLFAEFLMLYKINTHGIWSDEKASLSCATGIVDGRGPYMAMPDDINLKKDIFTSNDYWNKNSIKNVVKATVYNNAGNSLFYNIVLHSWLFLFGPTDFSIRFLSVVFGMLTVILSYYFTKSLLKSVNACMAALTTMILFAVHPLLVYSGQEARGYAAGIFFSFLASYILLKITRYKESRMDLPALFVVYAAAVIASLFSHYFTVYIFLAHAVYMIFIVRDKKIWVYFVGSMLCVVAVLIFWMFIGGFQSLKVMGVLDKGIKERVSAGATTSFSALTAGWAQALLAIAGNYFQWLGFRIRDLAPVLLIPLTILLLCWNVLLKKIERKYFYFLILLVLACPALATVSSLRSGHTISFSPRYAVFSIPYAIILLSLSFCYATELPRLKRSLFFILFAAQIIVMAISLKVVYEDIYKVYAIGNRPPRINNPYVSLADKIKIMYKTDDIVIYPSWGDAQLTNLYLKNRNDILQKVDTSSGDNVILLRHDSKEKLKLFNFEGLKYRY